VRKTIVFVLAAMAAGCAIGPRYVPPHAAVPPAYKEQASLAADLLQPARPGDQASRAGWWRAFRDPQLDDLEARLITANPALAEAEARFRGARALVRQQRAEYFPIVTATTSITRTHPAASSRIDLSSGTVTDYALGADVSWEADFWGRIRQTVASGTASAQAAGGDLENARLSLGAELAADYFELRSADA
jgi:outer membrane protein TolC